MLLKTSQVHAQIAHASSPFFYYSIQCPLEHSARSGSYESTLVITPLLGDLNGYFNASFQFCAFALDGSKLERGGHCMYKVTSSRGRVAQEQSKVSPRISFSFSANNSHHITFTCPQPCVVAMLVTAVSSDDLPVLAMEVSVPFTLPCLLYHIVHYQAASTAPAPAAKSPAPSPVHPSSTPAQAMWDVQKLMEVQDGKPPLCDVS
jgi:hypothetical protein